MIHLHKIWKKLKIDHEHVIFWHKTIVNSNGTRKDVDVENDPYGSFSIEHQRPFEFHLPILLFHLRKYTVMIYLHIQTFGRKIDHEQVIFRIP